MSTMPSENLYSAKVAVEPPSTSTASTNTHPSLEPSNPCIPTTNDFLEEYNKTKEELFQIHQVAQAGNIRRLEALLEEGVDPSEVDKAGMTPLHHAVSTECRCTTCLSNAEACIKLLLNTKNVDVNAQDNKRKTPLHLAIHNQLSKCAEHLISAGANLHLKSASGKKPVSLLAQKLPDTLIHVLDRCILVDQHEPIDEQCVLKVDFSPLIGKLKFKTSDERASSIDMDRCTNDDAKHLHISWQPEMKLLLSILENPATYPWRGKILTHPVVQIFMEQQWKRARKFFVAYFAIYILYVISYTFYVYDTYVHRCPNILLRNHTNNGIKDDFIGIADFRYERPKGCKCEIVMGANPLLVISLTQTIIFALGELARLAMTPKMYIRRRLNLGTWIFIFLVIITTIPNLAKQTYLQPRQYHAAALTVFLAWAFMLQHTGRFPSLGRYTEMFGVVLKNFGFFILTFISLLIAFAVAFCIVFPTRRTFKKVHRSFLKTLVMMTGEMDYHTLFYTTDEKGSFMGSVLFVGFALIVSIVLMNLVIGLAVQDIQQLKTDGELRRTSTLILDIYRLEYFIFSKRMPSLVGNKLKELISMLQPSKENCQEVEGLTFKFRPNSRRDTSVPEQLKRQALQLASTSYERFRAHRCSNPSHVGDKSSKFQARHRNKQQDYEIVVLKGEREQCTI